MSSLSRRLMRTGLRRGLLEGSGAWLAVGAAAVVIRVARRAMARRPEIVYSERLAPGEGLMIQHLPGAAKMEA